MATLDGVAETVPHRWYLQRDETGPVVESPDELFHRVTDTVAGAEPAFGGDADATASRCYRSMRDLDFLPNSPTLMNAGTDLQQLAVGFVLPVQDSIESISTTLKHTALIYQRGETRTGAPGPPTRGGVRQRVRPRRPAAGVSRT